MDGRQAYLRPSSAWAWSHCHGYAALNAALGATYEEESDNEVREDGTACHWLAAELWEGRPVSAGCLSPNGRDITDEMLRDVADYHAFLLAAAGTAWHIEERVPVSRYFPGVADGTPDAWGYDDTTLMLDVADLKYGFRPVEVWRNPQLIIYAWTLVCMLTEAGSTPQSVRLTIFQPRCAHPDGVARTWTVDIPTLAALAAELAAHAQRSYAPSPMCVAGAWCRNCAAAHGCRTLQAAAMGAVETSYDATPFELTAEQLAYELAKLMGAQKHIEHRINGLTTQAEFLVKRGQRVPGFKMGRAGTRWRWREGAQAMVQRFGEMFGVNVMQEPKLKTVAQLRNAFPVDIQAMYAEKPVGELKLMRVDPNEVEKAMGK